MGNDKEDRRIASINAASNPGVHTGSGTPYRPTSHREPASDKNPADLSWLRIAQQSNTTGISGDSPKDPKTGK